ncbi:MAG: hypothetical protein QXD19_00205 [Candidatus Bathyarchaeia archaeon]
MRMYVLKQYNAQIKPCNLCGESFKVGDRIIKTSRRRYHESCFLKLLH